MLAILFEFLCFVLALTLSGELPKDLRCNIMPTTKILRKLMRQRERNLYFVRFSLALTLSRELLKDLRIKGVLTYKDPSEAHAKA